jgi:hypothetical protein
MKKLSLILVTMLLLLAFVVPAAAAGPRVKIGDRISIFDGYPTSYPANTPFHIAHGWGFDPPNDVPSNPPYSFSLELDGDPVTESFVLRYADPDSDPLIVWHWVYNFPEGLSGTHTFVGTWCNGLGCQTRELTVEFQ